MLQKVSFTPNVPVLVALKFKDGKLVEGRFGDQVYYSFDQDRCAYLDPDVAAKINQLDPKPGQPFEICKYWSGKKGEKPQWDVRWPGNVVQPVQLAASSSGEWDEADDRRLHDQLQTSIDQARNGRAAASAGTRAVAAALANQGTTPQPPAPTNKTDSGNGTNGKGAYGIAPAPANPLPPAENLVPANGNGNGKIPLKIPMDVAFDEILTWMKQALEAHHIQWNDASQQDFASTALIGGMREGWISPWRRRAA